MAIKKKYVVVFMDDDVKGKAVCDSLFKAKIPRVCIFKSECDFDGIEATFCDCVPSIGSNGLVKCESFFL